MINSAIRKIPVPVVVIVAAGIMMYPGILTLLRGDPLGSGIATIVVGLLTVLLYAGFELIDRLPKFGTRAERWASLALLIAVIGINAVLIYAVPDSPAAVGMLVVCAVGALIVLFEPTGRRSSTQS